ncbi:integrase core domain protein-like protein [Leptotrombidium deliense]|uniref:RNA-directed DNA polymerase n=1 Tax=Leptotrombidium deliense TaxID=299467 RepID=A0A443RXI8_9ACAR|nr:integrase core domain protein-like protein [Leptotrombidium deliense]
MQESDAFVFSINEFNISELQCKDPFWMNVVQNISKYKTHGYYIKDKILYRTIKTDIGERNLLCLPRKLKTYILSELHDAKEAGHLGFDKTFEKVKARFIWKGMTKDTKRYIDSCEMCQIANQKAKLKHGLMQHMPTADPFQIVAIDFAGPLPKTGRQNEYVVVLIDFGTRWVEAKALRSATADNVINFLRNDVFLRHSVPKQLISDRGVQFTSSKFDEFLKEYGVKHVKTTAYHPQSNGCVERQNKTLKNIISKYIAQDQRD